MATSTLNNYAKGKREGDETTRRRIAAYFSYGYQEMLDLGRHILSGEKQSSQPDADAIIKRLLTAKNLKNFKEVASYLGEEEKTISVWRKTNPHSAIHKIIKKSEKDGISKKWLLTGEGTPFLFVAATEERDDEGGPDEMKELIGGMKATGVMAWLTDELEHGDISAAFDEIRGTARFQEWKQKKSGRKDCKAA